MPGELPYILLGIILGLAVWGCMLTNERGECELHLTKQGDSPIPRAIFTCSPPPPEVPLAEAIVVNGVEINQTEVVN